MRMMVVVPVAAAMLTIATSAAAHTAWLVREGNSNSWLLRFGGHEGKLEPAVPSKLKQVKAYDARGMGITINRAVVDGETRLTTAREPAVIALHYDNGMHTRTATPGPSIEKPMTQVPGAVSAVWAVKYGKDIVRWTPTATRRTNQPFEVVPLRAAQPRAGQPMQVRVLQNGQPAAGVKIGRGEDTADAVTDLNGIATFVPQAGFNKLWAGRRIAQKKDPRFTELSYEYLLSFGAR